MIVPGFEVIEAADRRWDEIISYLPYDLQDVHFSSAWYRAHENSTQKGRLAVVADAGMVVAQPFMLRDIPGTDFKDMTSIGYGGPLTSSALPNPTEGEILESCMDWWRRDNRVVSEFYLLNPCFMAEHWVLLPADPVAGRDVYIVPLDSDEVMESRMRPTRIQSINKVKNPVLNPRIPPDSFQLLYDAAMKRKDAAQRWRFLPNHFDRLARELGDRISFVGIGNSMTEPMAVACFTRGTAIAYYYLAATAENRIGGYADLCVAAGLAASRSVGCRWLHLGGGLGGENDTLATYKRSFGGIPRRTYSMRRIYDHEAYEQLTKGKPASGFFPAYRAEEA